MNPIRALILIMLAAVPVIANELQVGELVTVPTSLDEDHSYVLYLPSDYDPAKEWPVLYCLDARGRGELVAEIFRDAAEEFSWILACSNNTASDGAFEPNVVAMRYLWYDTHQRLSIDDDRIYATGFSGVSRFLWLLPGMKMPLKGMIGVGGTAPWRPIPEMEIDFDYYGVVGIDDFNWAESNELQWVLEERGVDHRLSVFDGPHGWSDPETAADAVRWMELRALRENGVAEAPERVSDWLSRDLDDLRRLIESGRLAEAADLIDSMERDYEGLIDPLELPEPDPKKVERARERRERMVREELSWMAAMQRPIGVLLEPGASGSEQFRAEKQLDIAGWKKKAEGDDPAMAHSANRRLATVFGQLSFYLPNMLLERGDAGRAGRALELAAQIDPESPRLDYQRARVLIEEGDPDAAVDQLVVMLEKLGWPGSALADDENLVKLKDNERFSKLIAGEAKDDSGQQE